MLWINPDDVTLAGAPLPGVSAITVNRTAERAAPEWSDAGPHCVFADVPEQRVAIRIVRTIGPGDTAAVRPGNSAALAFRVAPSLNTAGAVAISASVVVFAVTHAADPKRGMVQTIDAIAISADGIADPITETPVA